MSLALRILVVAASGCIATSAFGQTPGTPYNPVIQYPNVTRSQAGVGTYKPNSYPWYRGEAERYSPRHDDRGRRFAALEEKGLSTEQRNLARALDRDEYGAALASASALAATGDPFAKRHLGWMYLRGLGVSRDRETGVRLLREAATLGDGPSALALVTVYRGGYGVPRDRKEVDFWLKQAEASSTPEIRWRAWSLRRGY